MNHQIQDVIASVGRVLIASLFLLSGISKLSAPEATIAYIASSGLPLPTLAYLGALFAELVLPLVLVLGFKTRIVAAALALFTVVTALVFHADLGDQNQFIHFFKNVVIAGGLLQVVAFGAGKLSLDGWLATRRA